MPLAMIIFRPLRASVTGNAGRGVVVVVVVAAVAAVRVRGQETAAHLARLSHPRMTSL